VEFFLEEYPGLVRALFVLTGERQEAEELAQEALARAYERWERVSAMGSPGGYVYKTAVNLNRKRVRHMSSRLRILNRATPPAPADQAGEHRAELALALQGLSQGQREAFMLVEVLGLSSEEVAPILGIESSSVRSRVHRAREVLRESLSEEAEDRG
jgi:RNA polymerase sigma-70 factor, ECF subfamily